jgi:hypothetical protein
MPRDASTIAEVPGKVRVSVKTNPFFLLPALLFAAVLAIACGSAETAPIAPGEALASPPDSFIKAPHKGASTGGYAPAATTTADAPPLATTPAAPVDAGAGPKDAGAGPRDAGKAAAADAGKTTAPRDAGAAAVKK